MEGHTGYGSSPVQNCLVQTFNKILLTVNFKQEGNNEIRGERIRTGIHRLSFGNRSGLQVHHITFWSHVWDTPLVWDIPPVWHTPVG